MSKIKGFKVFLPGWICRPNGNFKQYACPGKFEEDVVLNCCGQGMHFCETVKDCFNYYAFSPNNKVAEVIAYGQVVRDGNKLCTDKLELVREIPWEEVLRLVNTGHDNTGCGNIGNWNAGNNNTGNNNAGDGNIGYNNTGDGNTGDWNIGNNNTGDRNAGYGNAGNNNTGDWNLSDGNTGSFMTKSYPIMMFNKQSDWTYKDWLRSEARQLLNTMSKDVVKWVDGSDMTDEEKKDYPTYEITGGYLKELKETESNQPWWDSLVEEDKATIQALPNFDADIFLEVTGIRCGKTVNTLV